MFDPTRLEEKWQAFWAANGTNEPDLDGAPRPYYNLMMFPYPSAEGLHVGNLYAFTGADFHARFQRLQGQDVFEPIGFDAFGIHSENYALKVDVHPMDLIPRSIANFTRQLERSGIMFDWSHTVDTTDPEYYRWTQWIFLQLYDAGLAVKKEAPVNWCPSCKTVLANEQVEGGKCERCDAEVGQRLLSQWFFRITEYAERLLANLDWIDWSPSTLTAQRNWIGRSEGALLRFRLAGGRSDTLEVFTTRPDTIFGATFMVLAPEHPLVDELTTEDQRAAVDAYRSAAAAVDLVERRKTDDRTKTGVFTGGFAVNPASGLDIPVWIADYVLMEYGTGAIMAVPGHDQRDFEFARQFGLEILPVVAPAEVVEAAADPGAVELELGDEAFVEHSEGERLINSGRFSGLPAAEGAIRIVEWLGEKGLGEPKVNYRLHDWCISRQRYWGPPIPMLYCDACGTVPVPAEDLPVVLPHLEHFKPGDDGVAPLAKDASFYRTTCPSCGGEARRETDVSDTFLDSAWYFLRYPSTDFDDRPIDPARTDRWLPVDTVHRRGRARGASPPVLPLHHDGAARSGTHSVRGAVPALPEARPDHPGRREDVQDERQRREPGRVHRPVRRGHVPHLPDVPRARTRKVETSGTAESWDRSASCLACRTPWKRPWRRGTRVFPIRPSSAPFTRRSARRRTISPVSRSTRRSRP